MKTKMKLRDLKVNSFTTNIDAQQAQTAKGGLIPIFPSITITILESIARHCITVNCG